LAQTWPNIEVVVVVDGPDEATTSELEKNPDPRLRVIVLAANEGGSAARNAGVEAARGEWIAFLDDDDEWVPRKTESQLAIALNSRYSVPIVSSRIIARSPAADYVWPRRLPSIGEPVGDYLFARKALFQGEGLLATPTLFTTRKLLLEVPFRNDLKKHQDWDWILRAARHKGVGIEFEGDALAIVHMEDRRSSVSQSDDWRFSLSWIRENRNYVSERAYGAFLLTVVAGQASGVTTLREYGAFLTESVQCGKPGLVHFLLYAGMRLFPREQRWKLRRLFGHAS
jgi:glycosyltransferase involved in cell wall biosynthesis